MVLRLLGWTAIAAIAILSLVPGQFRPHIGTSHYFEHFTAYCLTAGLLAFAYQGRLRAAVLFACLVIYAGALETAQLWVPGRLSQMSDFITSSFGSLVGILVVAVIRQVGRRIAIRSERLGETASRHKHLRK